MKPVLFVLALGLFIAACSKSSSVTPVPDAGNVVAGTYPLTFIEEDSATVKRQLVLPYVDAPSNTTISGSLTARRDSANVVFLTQTLKVTGQADQTQLIGQINLKANGSSYDMYQSNQKIGTADGTVISIDVKQTDPQTGIAYEDIITAHK